MSERVNAVQVGAPDPEKRNSLVVEDSDYDYDVRGQEVPDTALCLFNDVEFVEKSYVCSGDQLLRCEGGVWVRIGSCDPVNP
ncbi:MAG: hypothetical protein M0R77_14280 [Gammaproteobacteria bacterium]|nr:hypothetical protein [Gammaproteobacteria bacterium]